jgi:hypothetical protein
MPRHTPFHRYGSPRRGSADAGGVVAGLERAGQEQGAFPYSTCRGKHTQATEGVWFEGTRTFTRSGLLFQQVCLHENLGHNSVGSQSVGSRVHALKIAVKRSQCAAPMRGHVKNVSRPCCPYTIVSGGALVADQLSVYLRRVTSAMPRLSRNPRSPRSSARSLLLSARAPRRAA